MEYFIKDIEDAAKNIRLSLFNFGFYHFTGMLNASKTVSNS